MTKCIRIFESILHPGQDVNSSKMEEERKTKKKDYAKARQERSGRHCKSIQWFYIIGENDTCES